MVGVRARLHGPPGRVRAPRRAGRGAGSDADPDADSGPQRRSAPRPSGRSTATTADDGVIEACDHTQAGAEADARRAAARGRPRHARPASRARGGDRAARGRRLRRAGADADADPEPTATPAPTPTPAPTAPAPSDDRRLRLGRPAAGRRRATAAATAAADGGRRHAARPGGHAGPARGDAGARAPAAARRAVGPGRDPRAGLLQRRRRAAALAARARRAARACWPCSRCCSRSPAGSAGPSRGSPRPPRAARGGVPRRRHVGRLRRLDPRREVKRAASGLNRAFRPHRGGHSSTRTPASPRSRLARRTHLEGAIAHGAADPANRCKDTKPAPGRRSACGVCSPSPACIRSRPSSGSCATRGSAPCSSRTDVEFPSTWSQNATNIVAQKYFRGQLDSPARERSVKQMVVARRGHDRRLGPPARLLRHRRGRRHVRGRADLHPAAPAGGVQLAGLVQRGLRGEPSVQRRASRITH